MSTKTAAALTHILPGTGPFSVHQPPQAPSRLYIVCGDTVVKNYSRESFCSNDKTIADVMSGKNHSSTEWRDLAREANANQLAAAHLEAAGPDLLAALERMLPAYREAVKLFDPNHDDALTVQAHNAIAKARGGA